MKLAKIKSTIIFAVIIIGLVWAVDTGHYLLYVGSLCVLGIIKDWRSLGEHVKAWYYLILAAWRK